MQSRVQIERRFRQTRGILFLVWVSITAIIVSLVVLSAARRAENQILQEARETLSVQSETLSGILDKYRLMAPLLARQSSVASLFVLDAQDNPQAVAANLMARSLTGMSAALDIGFFFPDGKLLGHASSPFVNERTGLDELLTEARQGRLGRAMLSLGPENRSYAFSSGVRRNGNLVGIVIVYVDYYRVESAWALSTKPIYVTDRNGRVLLANVANWRMREITGLFHSDGPYLSATLEGESRRFIDLTRDLPVLDWRLHVLSDPAPISEARLNSGAIATLACLLAGLIALGLFERYATNVFSRRTARANALRLERVVRDRTRELSLSNASLSREVDVRRETELRLRAAQVELVQTTKLATLGQMSAAISHEYNQPLGAIRSYADNGKRFLEMGKVEKVNENLTRINALVDRMAELSRTLLSFVRRPGQSVGPTRLGTVVEEALLLARPRARKAGVRITIGKGLDAIYVLAGRVRLGQVFVNLINNAVDALDGQDGGTIEVKAVEDGDRVVISVRDNGPGIPSDIVERVFDPFYTTKATGEGIGIGLSICENIIRDFGGSITVRNMPEGGAEFRIELQKAAAGEETKYTDTLAAVEE